MTFRRKLSLLGGLLIILDLAQAGPLNNLPNKGRPKPLTGGPGSLISSVSNQLPGQLSPSLAPSILSSSSNPNQPAPQPAPQTLPQPSQPIPPIPPLSPSSPAAPQAPTVPNSVLGAPQPQMPHPGGQPPPQINQGHHPNQAHPITFGLSQRPPNNYANSHSQSAVGTSQSSVTFSQSSGGTNPLVTVVGQSVNDLGQNSTPNALAQGVDNILQAVSPVPSKPSHPLGPPPELEAIKPEEIKPEAQPLEQILIVDNAIDTDEDEPFNLEAYLAQANLVLTNNANYYSPPPTASSAELVSEAATPELTAPAPEAIAPQPSPENLPPMAPAIMPLSTSVVPTEQETVVIVTTAGSHGNDAVQVINVTPQINPESNLEAAPQAASPASEQNEVLPPNQPLPSPQQENSATPANPPNPPNSATQLPQNAPQNMEQQQPTIPSEEPVNNPPPQEWQPQQSSIPPTDQYPHPPFEMQPLQAQPPQNQENAPSPNELTQPEQPQSEPQSIPATQLGPPPQDQLSSPENNQLKPDPMPIIQTIYPTVQDQSTPTNIILEATITNAQHSHESGSSEGGEAPPSYIFVPLQIPPDVEGTLTISAVPLDENGQPIEDDEDYPPFDVDQYLAQAALFLGSPGYGSIPLDQQYSSESFQSSVQLHDGETDNAIQIIPAPSLLESTPSSEEDHLEIHVQSEPLDLSDHSGPIGVVLPEEVQPLAPSEDEVIAQASQPETQIVPVNMDGFTPIINGQTQAPETIHPHQYPPVPEGAMIISVVPAQPIQETPIPSHLAPILDIPEGSAEEELSDTSALEALAAESEDSNDNLQHTFIPVYLLSVPSDNSNQLQMEPPAVTGNAPSPLQGQNDLQWTPQTKQPEEKEIAPGSGSALADEKVERSRPMRPVGSLGLFGRPSQLGISPMHTYTGSKLNNLMGSLGSSGSSSSASEEGSSGESRPHPFGSFANFANNKNQNNGSLIMHDNRNPQNGMMHVIGNTVFNSHVSGDQPTQFTVPANAASFIMAQGQKVPFNLSPSFDSLFQRPPAPSQVSSLSSSPTEQTNSTAPAPPPPSPNYYNNYYYPEDGVRNATVLIQNGMMRPLVSPVFLVVNTNSDHSQGPSHPINDVKVLANEDFFNSSNNVNVVKFSSETSVDQNGIKKESQNVTGTHLAKRTATPNKSIVGSNASIPIPPMKSNGKANSSESAEILKVEESKAQPVILPPPGPQGKPVVKPPQEAMAKPPEAPVKALTKPEPAKTTHKIAEQDIKKESQKEAESVEESKEESEESSEITAPEKESKPEKAPAKETQKVLSEAPPKEKPDPAEASRSPPKESPPASSSGPSLPQPPPAPEVIGLPEVPDVPGALGDIRVPDPNVVTPTVPVPSVSIPNVPNPKPLGDTKGLNKGLSASKAKPSKGKPNNPVPPKQPNNPQPAPQPQAPQQYHQPQQPQPQYAPQAAPAQQPSYQQPYEYQQPEQIYDHQEDIEDDDDKYDDEEDDDEEGYDQEQDEKSSDSIIGSDISPPIIPSIPQPTIEKALPGKYGSGNGKPSVVPSLAAFSAPYTNSPSPSNSGGNTFNSAPASNSNLNDKGCTCGTNNNNQQQPSGGNNNGNSNGNGGNKRPPQQQQQQPQHQQQQQQIDEDSEEHTNVRPPRPNKPKRPSKPNRGNKKPKPQNADKFKENGFDEELERIAHGKLVAVLTKPQLHQSIKGKDKEKETNKKDDDCKDNHHTHKNLAQTLKENEIKDLNFIKDRDREEPKPQMPIRVTFVSNNEDSSSKPQPLGGPIKVTFVTNKDETKSTPGGGPVKVTFSSSALAEREEDPFPIKITLLSNNSTKNETQPSRDKEPEPEVEPTPVKQQQDFLTTTNWFGWEIPTVNWAYFTDLFNSFFQFQKSFRASNGIFQCDEGDGDGVVRSELEVDYLCGGEEENRAVDANVCNIFCSSYGFHSGACMPQKSCLCYMTDVKNFAIKLDRLPDSNYNPNITEKASLDEGESCQSCKCLKSCQSAGKYVGYCSKSCHCGVPWYNEFPTGMERL